MLSPRYVRSALLVFSTALLILNFQNCAPMAPGQAEASSAGGGVQLIDEFNKSEIQFVASESKIHDEASAAGLDGLCPRAHTGGKLRWTVASAEHPSQPLLQGESVCRGGKFGVELEALPEIVCGVKHLVVLEAEWGGSTFTQFERRCQPLATERAEPPGSSPPGTECALEYQLGSDSGATCSRVCYRAEMVVSEQVLDAGACSGLAAKLSGP